MQHKHQHIPIHQVMKAFHWQHQPDEAKWLQLHLHRSKQLGRLKMRHPKNPPKNGPFFRRTIGFGVPQFSDMPKCVGLTNNNRKTIGCIHIYIWFNRCYCQKQMDPICQQQIHKQIGFPGKAINPIPLAGVKKGRFGTNSSAKASDLSSLTSTWIFQSYSHFLMVLWDFYILSTPGPLYIYSLVHLKVYRLVTLETLIDGLCECACIYIYMNHICKYKRAMGD